MPWDGPTFQIYYQRLQRTVVELLATEDGPFLLQVDFDEYLDRLISRFEWQRLDWDESSWTIEPVTKKVTKNRSIDGRAYTVDETRLQLRVSISPHPMREEYFRYGPSTTWTLQSEPQWRFEGDVLIHEVEATEAAGKQGKEDVRFWLGNRNEDIELGNKTLREKVRNVWKEKRRQLEEQHGETQEVLRKLNIPLHRDPSASVKPINMKPRKLRPVAQKPKAKAAPAEPTLRREDVADLVTFIEQYARQLETAPKTYGKMGEDELRDILLGMINANYSGSATGETFRKLGKTDISLRVDAGNVLVCECKFWAGRTAYSEALGQLFGYLTWRENYGVLIHFCKLKDMSGAVAKAKRVISEHGSFASGSLHDVSETRFTSRHSHPQDSEKSLEVHHLFFDLSV